MAIHNIYKPIGWTPLEAINAFKRLNPKFAQEPITYAGRLDPMAEGVLILLSREHRFKNKNFQKLQKTYEATFLFGLSSDTYDALGLIDVSKKEVPISQKDLLSFLPGKHILPFPPYSSYKVHGKPLHYWANQNKLDEIDIPLKEMNVLSMNKPTLFSKKAEEIKHNAISRIKNVHGSFRQEPIIQKWHQARFPSSNLQLAQCVLTVSSGTYIRSLAHQLGKEIGCGSILFSLKRTSVGMYTQNDSLSVL